MLYTAMTGNIYHLRIGGLKLFYKESKCNVTKMGHLFGVNLHVPFLQCTRQNRRFLSQKRVNQEKNLNHKM